MTTFGQCMPRFTRLFTGVVMLLWIIGFGVGGLAVWTGSTDLWRIADLCFDLSLLAAMASRGGSLLRP